MLEDNKLITDERKYRCTRNKKVKESLYCQKALGDSKSYCKLNTGL